MNAFLSAYLFFNFMIVLAYLLSRGMLEIPVFQRHLSQTGRLSFARFSFAMTVFFFLFLPAILKAFPSINDSHFQLKPFLKMTEASLTAVSSAFIGNENLMPPKEHFSFEELLNLLLILGFIYSLIRYVKNILILKNIQKNSFCQHQLKHLQILFNDSIQIPFCWSWLHRHYVVLPSHYLMMKSELPLVIRHELQHIRQGDTQYQQCIGLIDALCFWNPLVKSWMHWMNTLQEFACDEAVLHRKKTSALHYAACLTHLAQNLLNQNVLPQSTLGMYAGSPSIFYRRVNMILKTPIDKAHKGLLVYLVSSFLSVSLAYAFNGQSSTQALSDQDLTRLIQKDHLDTDFQIKASPSLLKEINQIRSSEEARTYLRESLKRMQSYKPMIQAAFQKNGIPNALMAIPLAESGYQSLDETQNPLKAAGIWQMIPDTGRRYGLVINADRDDRMNPGLSTKAAVSYLQFLHDRFHNWKLAVIAYEIGELKTEDLMKETHSDQIERLTEASTAPLTLKKFNNTFDAELIILQHPELIN